MNSLKMIILNTVILLTASLILFGCGSDEDTPSGNESTPPVALGSFVDSKVTGIKYTTDSTSGFTDIGGQFPLVAGENISFGIGDITLPSIPSKATITPLDIFNTTDINNISVVNLSRLLQTLDCDGDVSNGIELCPDIHSNTTGLSIQFDSPTFDSDSDVAQLIANSGTVNSTLIKATDAVTHLQNTINEIPASGVYFEVYGSTTITNNISLPATTTGHTLLGTSNSGMVFNVSGFNTFIIYVPSGVGTLMLDAISLNNLTAPVTTNVGSTINIGENLWINSGNGITHTHVSQNFNPFSDIDPQCTEFTDICTVTFGSGTRTMAGQSFIEGPNDGFAIKSNNTPNSSYYISNTLSASSIRVFLAN